MFRFIPISLLLFKLFIFLILIITSYLIITHNTTPILLLFPPLPTLISTHTHTYTHPLPLPALPSSWERGESEASTAGVRLVGGWVMFAILSVWMLWEIGVFCCLIFFFCIFVVDWLFLVSLNNFFQCLSLLFFFFLFLFLFFFIVFLCFFLVLLFFYFCFSVFYVF